MKLFINGNNLNNPYWGVPRVAFELIRSLDNALFSRAHNIPFREAVLVGRSVNNPIPGLKAITYEHLPAPNSYIWEHVSLARRTGKHLLLGLQNRNPLLKENCATLIHGIQTITQPESYSARDQLEARIMLPVIGSRHRTILTVSNFSAEELQRHAIAKAHKLRVIYNGIDHQEPRSGVMRSENFSWLEHHRYVLAQSSAKHHKNIRILFEAFSDYRLSDFKLVLFGSDQAKQFEGIGIKIPANCIFVGMVGDAELTELMRNALCLAFPSLTEGFGLPPLEAMAQGTPAIVSNRGAIPEVCGDSAIIIDPQDANAWTEAILFLRTNEAGHQKYSSAGFERAKKFSWKASTNELLNVLADRHG